MFCSNRPAVCKAARMFQLLFLSLIVLPFTARLKIKLAAHFIRFLPKGFALIRITGMDSNGNMVGRMQEANANQFAFIR